MLSEIFYWLLNMSISASIAGCIILLLGRIRKIPRRIIHLLWIIPLLRMWIPVGVNSKYSLMTLISKFATKSITVYSGFANLSMTNSMMAADTYFPLTYKVSKLEAVYQIAGIVWMIIAIALLIIMGIVYGVTKWEIKDVRHLRDNVFLSRTTFSPAAYGIIGPRIVVPEIYDSVDY